MNFGSWDNPSRERVHASPLAHESNIIARCQSARSVHGRAAEPWGYEASVAWLHDAGCKPAAGRASLNASLPGAGAPSPSSGSTVGQAGSHPFAGDWPDAEDRIDRYADIRGV